MDVISTVSKSPQARGAAPPISHGDTRVKNACTECKRRKVKCDGTEPCYFCKWYKHPERCLYPRPVPRPILTRKSLDALRSRLEDATNILKRLFPASSIDELIPLPRDTLVALLDDAQPGARHPTAAGASSTDGSPQSPGSVNIPRASKSPTAFEYNESIENLEGTEAVADDVNALSLRSDRTSSYVGASSAMAGLRVLLKIAPDFKFVNQKSTLQLDSSGPSFGAPSQVAGRGATAKASPDPRSLVDAYFQRIHPTTPILDETLFRVTFESKERKDSAWLGLLHMVLALGAIAYTTSDSNEDIYYYKIAKSHVSLDSFGSGHIETLQALTLMTGWYLHYRNRPNMASAIMGAVFRMAHALGLHKEFPGEETGQDKQQRELRRRIWWSLVVLDTGEGSTLGRVSNTNIFDSETGEPITGPTVYSMLIADVEFSRQASKIQDRLISSPSLEFTETLALDAHLVYWFESLPSFFHAPEPCPDWLLQPRSSAKWKYQNLRIMLHRPILMEAALRRIQFQELNGDQKVCVRKCQSLASQAIENIASEWTQNQYSGWPAVWFLFQACIIPLLSLYGFNEDSQQTEDWNQQVRKAIQLFKEMEQWSIAARQTHELVSLLYEAYHKSLASDPNTQEVTSTFITPAGLLDNPQPIVPPTQSHNMVQWPLWEGHFNFPEMVYPVSAFPDLNFPDLNFPDLNFPELEPGANPWDIPMEIEDWGETTEPSIRHIQADDRMSKVRGTLSVAWPRRRL